MTDTFTKKFACMPRHKRRKRSTVKDSEQDEKGNVLELLPLPALALIYQQLDSKTRLALLQTSRWGRDIVLAEAKSVRLKLSDTDASPAARKPLLRLLARVCSGAQGAAGRLSLAVDALHVHEKRSKLLYDMLHPASSQQSGWTSVGQLKLQGTFGTSSPVKLIVAAFPALQRLEFGNLSLAAKHLSQLSACTQLSHLAFSRCKWSKGISSSNPLAGLASLSQLTLINTRSSIAAGLTQLTSLALVSDQDESTDTFVAVLSGMAQLQQLTLKAAAWRSFVPAHIQPFIPTIAQLRSFSLQAEIDQEGFDVLLAHATQLTYLSCDWLELAQDRSASACTWREVVIAQAHHSLDTLAHLPLHSLTRLCFNGDWSEGRTQEKDLELPSACPKLKCSTFEPEEFHSTVQLLRQALSNLARCPAWQSSGPAVHLCILMDADGFPSDSCAQLFPALATLASKQVQLDVDIWGAHLRASDIQLLGSILGPNLTHLTVENLLLSQDLWPAVWAHLPGLQQLELRGEDEAEAPSAESLAAFCSHATRPLQLALSRGLYTRTTVSAERLQAECRVWGVPQVTVSVVEG